jgi:hypothetical protein
VTPRRRTAILAALSLGTVAILLPAAYIGYQATIGGKPSDELCFVNPASSSSLAARSVGYSTTKKWTWRPPRYVFTCVYEMRGGRTLRRPPPK